MAGTPHKEMSGWPALPLSSWAETRDSLHLRLQMVGKVRLALAPMQNHWWQAALYVTPRGLTTSAIPYSGEAVEVRFDFLDHVLVIDSSHGDTRRLPLTPRPIAEYYRELMEALAELGIPVEIWPHPVEIGDPIPFGDDRTHCAYDPAAAERCWRLLVQVDRVFQIFRGQFVGKCSPVHLWWGGFDLACTRFSGRRAPRHPGGIPNTPDHVAVEAYSHECISAGWWPGGGGGPVDEPAFYAYSYPEPPGFKEANVEPAAAYYHQELGEFVLPYEAVRTAKDPDEALLAFLQSTYAAAADLAGWDRLSLERPKER